MNALAEKIFPVLFDTDVPRIVLSANVPDFTVITYNNAYKTAVYIENKDIVGQSLWDTFDPEDAVSDGAKLLADDLKHACKSGEKVDTLPFHYKIPSIVPGEKVDSWWQLEIIPILNKEKEVEFLLMTTHNITEQVLNKETIEQAKYREQHLNEELAATNEELVATNEELASSNEELIAINEELHHSKQELNRLNGILEQRVLERTRQLEQSYLEQQSISEEMIAANEEIAASNEELVNANDELEKSRLDLQETFLQLSESESRFSFLISAMPQQVWTARPDGSLDFVNNIVARDFGRTSEEIVGHGWQEFIHPDDLRACLKAWITSLETGEEYSVQFRLRFADGTYRWHLARAVPLIEDGITKLWLGTNTNIDQQKNKEQQKDEFLSIASHELKTPLTGIKAFNQMMLKTTDKKMLDAFAIKSADSVRRLERIITDLLDVTKINAGKLNYNIEPFSLKKLLTDSIENIQQVTPSHKIILKSVEDITYTGDRFRLEQVMQNFLSNAVKYSPKADKVVVSSRIEQDNIIVSVQDFGIGIAENEMNRLFDRYYRVDNTAMRFEGLGLGLFIASEILKQHQGSFWIESERGRGSVFSFRLPLHAAFDNDVPIQSSTFYRDSTITIEYQEPQNQLYVDWTGFQDLDSVKQGGMRMLSMLKKNKCTKVINDNTHVLGTWSEASDWAAKEWFPMMEEQGMRYFAWVFSPNMFSQLSAKKSVDTFNGNVVIQFFTEAASAQEWISGK